MRARVVALAGWLVATAAQAHAECKPAAVVEGDAALAGALAVQLVAGGIATRSTVGCPAVQVRLEKRGEQVHLRVTDAFDRAGERDVQDVATAAAIVASWTLQEVEEGSLPVAVEPEPARLVRDGVAVTAVSALASDHTTWVGAAATMCFRFGPVCSGPRLRAERDTRATGGAGLAQDVYALSAGSGLDLPLRLGGLVVSPGVVGSFTWVHVTSHERDAMDAPIDVVTTDHQLRVGAHASLLWAWSRHVSVLADAGGEMAIAHIHAAGPTGALWLALGVRIEAR